LGSCSKLTTEEARAKAREILAKAELGVDVAEERARDRAEINISTLCEKYLAEGCRTKRPSTVKSDVGRIRNHIMPLLGRKKVSELSKGDVERMMVEIASSKTARDVKTGKQGRSIVRGGEVVANRTMRLLSSIYTFAINELKMKVENPCKGIKPYRESAREVFLTSDEIARVAEILRLAETEGLPWTIKANGNSKHLRKNAANERVVVSSSVTNMIRLYLLTGCRGQEIRTLRWSMIDFERGVLNLPDSKTGKRSIILNDPTIQLLRRIPKISDCVFPGRDIEKPITNIKRGWDRVREYALLDGLRLHDLRHTFASLGADAGLSLLAISKLLGHSSLQSTQRYAHLVDAAQARASNLAVDKIANVL